MVEVVVECPVRHELQRQCGRHPWIHPYRGHGHGESIDVSVADVVAECPTRCQLQRQYDFYPYSGQGHGELMDGALLLLLWF